MVSKKVYRLKDGREVLEDEYDSLPEEEQQGAECIDIQFEFEDIGSTTRFSVVKQVATKMGYTDVDEWSEEQVKEFLLKWRELPLVDRIRYGMWGKGTREYEAQQLMEQGIPPEEALKRVGLVE